MQEYANQNIKDWKEGIIGAYLAASYKMLKQNIKAAELISNYRLGAHQKNTNQFNNTVANDAIYALITRNYFDTKQDKTLTEIQDYINSGHYDSFTAAAIIMALATEPETGTASLDDVAVFANDKKLKSDLKSDVIQVALPYDVNKLRVNCPTCKTDAPLFATFVQQGFPINATSASNGIEISRKYYDANGNEITAGNIGDIIDVKIVARTRGGTEQVSNAVITDLLPGGFIPMTDSLNGEKEFSEIHEDRILIYTALSRTPSVFTYRAQISAAGKFAVPPIAASDMYNAAVNATGESGTFTVSNETK